MNITSTECQICHITGFWPTCKEDKPKKNQVSLGCTYKLNQTNTQTLKKLKKFKPIAQVNQKIKM